MSHPIPTGRSIHRLSFLLFAMLFSLSIYAQEVTVYQYRKVPPEKAEEFVKRETTYWSKVARQAIDKGALNFWALLERVDGADVANEPNYLFVNTFPNMDTDAGDIWNPSKLFPTIPITKMETYSMSKVTGQYFLSDQGWQQAKSVNPMKDFNYIIMVYHNSTDPGSFIELEKRHWGPFIQGAMDNKQTTQVGWGNAYVLAPTGNNVRFNSVSYDLFPTMKATLFPNWAASIQFPAAGLDSLGKIEKTMPNREIYRIVKAESKN